MSDTHNEPKAAQPKKEKTPDYTVLKKETVIGGKSYKKGDKFSHANKKVVEFLLTNKIIK